LGNVGLNVDERVILILILRQQVMIIWPEINCIKVGLVVIADIIKNCHENPKIGLS
jgi:hypothetical protein